MKNFRRLLILPLIVWPLAAISDDSQVHEYTLDNGMKVIVKEDHRAPVVVSQVWYKVGSSYEYNGITGLSHVLEHMMFKGTKSHAAGEFSRIIAENGGRENAFTSRDYTAYYQELEKSRLPVSFEMEADRMRNLLMQPEEFAKEVQVVMEERRMRVEDDPGSTTYERFNATAYTNSPYRYPVIGWMNDLENLTIDDMRVWYDSWYAPNNATLVVVGDVNPDEVHRLAKEYYGKLEPGKVPDVKPRREVPQHGRRDLVVRVPAQLPSIIMGYKVPVVSNAEREWEPYALEVLAGILDGGSSARFARELIRKQEVAAGAGAGYNPYTRQESLFLIDGTPAQDRTVKELEKALLEQIARLRQTPPDAKELERVKAQVVARDVYERDSPFYQAMQIGTLETVGLGWRIMDEYVDRIRAVTPEQIQEVAKKYLIEEGLTVAVLDPLPIENGKAPPQTGGGDLIH